MKPSAGRVLMALEEAGECGMQAGEIANLFDEGTRQRCNVRVNTILKVWLKNGNARRTGPEPSLSYTHTPVYRWYITEKGFTYLATGMRRGQIARNRAEREREQSAQERKSTRLAKLLANVSLVDDKCERDAEIRHLRSEGCYLDPIGDRYGITRERARQISCGVNITPCLTPGHDYWVTPCSHGLVTGPQTARYKQRV